MEVLPSTNELVSTLFFPNGVAAGMLLAWCNEMRSGRLSAGSLALFYLWNWVSRGRLPTGIWFLLTVMPAFLFLTSAFV